MAESPGDKRLKDAGGSQLEFGDIATPALWDDVMVRRADGRQLPFDLGKLAESIAQTAQPGESLDNDTAHSLARAAALFLRRARARAAVSSERIAELAEALLKEMGYTASARAYARRFGPWAQHASHFASTATRNAFVGPEQMEAFLENLVIEAGLGPAGATNVIGRMKAGLEAAGLSRPTAALLREWFAITLREQGMEARADRLSRVSLPAHVIDEAFQGRASEIRPTAPDPEGAADNVAELTGEAFALDAILPAEAADAHLRGAIHMLGLGHVLKLDTLNLDLEGLKRAGPLIPNEERAAPPPVEPDALIRQLGDQTDVLRAYVYRRLSWSAVNFGLAPYLEGIGARELRGLAQVLIFEFARRHARRSSAAPAIELQFHWDGPEAAGGNLHGPGGQTVPVEEALAPARRFLEAVLDTLAELADQGTEIQGFAPAFHLSPYFFGAPEAGRMLERMARIALGPNPLTLRYDSPSALPLDLPMMDRSPDILGQSVVIDLARPARLVPDVSSLIPRFDKLIDVAVSGVVGKHRYLERIAHHRNGPLGLFRRTYGVGPIVDLNALRYRLAIAGLPECVRAVSGTPWHEGPDAAAAAEAIVGHLADACDRWTVAAKRPLVPAFADPFDAVWTRAPGQSAFGPTPSLWSEASAFAEPVDYGGRDALTPMERVRLEAPLHPLLSEPQCTLIPRPVDETSPSALADFMRKAFLTTACRGLRFG